MFDWDDFKDMAKFFGGFFALCAAFVGLFMIGVYQYRAAQCRDAARVVGVPSEYTMTLGCMLYLQDTRVELSRIIPVEKDGKITYSVKPTVRFGAE